MQQAKVLFVDDEQSILDAFRRQLADNYQVDTANGAEKALNLVKAGSEFSVVVSDMHMPGVDGVDFLKRMEEQSPDTIRIMLTGYNDQEIAVRAINEGHIFRFLSKPCSTQDLEVALSEALQQRRLVQLEKDILRNTLGATVKTLTDLLSLADPLVFSHALSLRNQARLIAETLDPQKSHEVELTAMLSPIGLVTLPENLRLKVACHEKLNNEERSMYEKIPEIGYGLLNGIPRLEGVARSIRYHLKNYDGTGVPHDEVRGEAIPFAARVTRALLQYSDNLVKSRSRFEALQLLYKERHHFDPEILRRMSALAETTTKTTHQTSDEQKTKTVKGFELSIGNKLAENVETNEKVLIFPKDTTITLSGLIKIRNYSALVGIKEPILIYAGAGDQ